MLRVENSHCLDRFSFSFSSCSAAGWLLIEGAAGLPLAKLTRKTFTLKVLIKTHSFHYDTMSGGGRWHVVGEEGEEEIVR